MAVSQSEFERAKGFFFDLEIVAKNPSGEITAIVAIIRGINGSKTSVIRRHRQVDYRLLAEVSYLRSSLPEGWIVKPGESQIEHVNIWPADSNCPLTSSRMPRICWGDGHATWSEMKEANRTLSSFLEVARQVLNGANLLSPAR